jgi:hypothetical protein
VVSHCHGWLIKRLYLLDERLDLICSVEQTELSMEVEMNEGRRHAGILGGQGREVKREGMEADDLLCSRNARPQKALVGRAQWKINQPPSLKRHERAWKDQLYRLTRAIEDQPGHSFESEY